MLLEFDADQRLWQETVRDAVGKQCPPALVRGVAEDGVDPAPVWNAYVEHGWSQGSAGALLACFRFFLIKLRTVSEGCAPLEIQ